MICYFVGGEIPDKERKKNFSVIPDDIYKINNLRFKLWHVSSLDGGRIFKCIDENMVPCFQCDSKGYNICDSCDGTGQIECEDCYGKGSIENEEESKKIKKAKERLLKKIEFDKNQENFSFDI